MKFQYFLRGVGFGILFASIIFMVVYNGNSANKTLSDEEIIKKAKELGMVEADTSLEEYLKETSNKKNTESTTKEDSNKNSTETTTENTNEKDSAISTTEETDKKDSTNTTKKTTEKQTEADNTIKQETTTETETGNNNTTAQTYQITVVAGESSYPVCQDLESLGLIDSADKFDNYLIEKGYAVRIRVGTHTLTKGMSYEEIAIAISDHE